MFQSIAVFCGSKNGNDPLFAKHAEQLGKLIAQQNITLIYGGGKNGLMGIVANAVLEQKGKVIGVMPELLNSIEHQHKDLTELHVVENMHARKKMMYDLCDAAIIMPGGFGTMDELFEIITWNNLRIHDKKIILLNSAGYYDILIKHIEQMRSQGFLYSNKKIFIIHNSPETIFPKDADKNQSLRE
jgi:uncharacterized protein (TIGR00730 family)